MAQQKTLSTNSSFPTETETHYELHEGAQVVQVGGLNFPPSPFLLLSRWFRVFGTTKRQIREKLKEKDMTPHCNMNAKLRFYYILTMHFVTWFPLEIVLGLVLVLVLMLLHHLQLILHLGTLVVVARCRCLCHCRLGTLDERCSMVATPGCPVPAMAPANPSGTPSESYFVYIWLSHKFIPFPGMHWAYLLERIVCPNLFRFVYRAGNEGTTWLQTWIDWEMKQFLAVYPVNAYEVGIGV